MSTGALLLSRERDPPKPVADFFKTQTTHADEIAAQAQASAGLATAGFRTSKYRPDEWHKSNYDKYYKAFADRDIAERLRHESKQLANTTEAITQRTQADVTKKLGERMHDITFWKSELNREIDDVIAETDLLLAQKKRLENALYATEIPYKISLDNLESRERRQGVDLVRDEPEVELVKEVEIIKSVQDLLRRTLEQTINQIRNNRDAKQNLEMDWSDKKDALEIDDKCARLNNQSTDIEYHPNTGQWQEFSSTPETWAQYSHDNIVRAEQERMASINLRALIDNVISDTSTDMHEQCNTVDTAMAKRLEELNDAKAKLENHLQKTLQEIASQEKNIAMLKQAIADKRPPMQVAQTRLHHRTSRPNVELCRDPAAERLLTEVTEITESIEALQRKLQNAEASLKDLMDTRMTLEKEIAVKSNSIFIDKQKVCQVRTRYPSMMKLTGYQ
ncbi:tektin-4-like [Branchiostoma floridae]|uniref:Tektin n=1 Tax=Branchiostoma floridae TaxID=7739 RepID=A0A9J7NA15_BRAFL|nr:tektin-4-like [Branchiostoma floridae]